MGVSLNMVLADCENLKIYTPPHGVFYYLIQVLDFIKPINIGKRELTMMFFHQITSSPRFIHVNISKNFFQ